MGRPPRLTVPLAACARRSGPYLLAGALLRVDFLLVARGLAHTSGAWAYSHWALDHSAYSDLVWLSLVHYVHGAQFVHPLPYVHDRIEYPVLLGFTLWLPSLLPGGPASWLAAAGVLTAGGHLRLHRPRPPAAPDHGVVARRHPRPRPRLRRQLGSDRRVLHGGRRGVVRRAALPPERGGRLGRHCFKLFPVVVAPMAVAGLAAAAGGDAAPPSPVSRAARGVAARNLALARWSVPFLVITVVATVPLLLVAPANTLWFFRYNSSRPQKDSVWELLGHLFGASLMGSPAIDSLSLVAVGAALGYGAWLVWRADEAVQHRAVALGAAQAVTVWMMVNKIWNPQYVLWVFAAAALVSAPARYGVALAVVSVYDWWYEFVVRVPDHTGPNSWLGLPRGYGPPGGDGPVGGVDARPAPRPGPPSRAVPAVGGQGVKAGLPSDATARAAMHRADSPRTASNHSGRQPGADHARAGGSPAAAAGG